MFAVIKTGGRQYRVVPDDVLEIGKIAGEVGTIVQLGEVLVLGGDTPVLGAPTVAGASVAAAVRPARRRSSRPEWPKIRQIRHFRRHLPGGCLDSLRWATIKPPTGAGYFPRRLFLRGRQAFAPSARKRY